MYMLKRVINKQQSEVINTRVPTHFVFVLDNSGSMSWVMENMRQDLKNKLSTLVEENDNVSILTFSSSNDVKVVIQDWQVKNIALDSTNFNKAIDNFVYARWCTCFNKPLDKAIELVKTNMATSVLFLTDGYHNDWGSKQDVLTAVDKLSKVANNFTIVEYGDYCDHRFLMEIVDIAGKNTVSNHMYQENMRYFEPVMHSFLKNEVMSSKKVKHTITDSKYPFVFSGETRFNIVDGEVYVPEDLESFVYNDTSNWESVSNNSDWYALAYHCASTRNIEWLYHTLDYIEDVYAANRICNSFGVEFTRATEYLKKCITDVSIRWIEWYAQGCIPSENAYCVLDLIEDLQKSDARIILNHEDFKYNRISKKMVQKNSIVTDEEKDSITNSKDLIELAKTKFELEFVPYNPDETFSLKDLTWNTSRANISFRVKKTWYVDITNVPWNTFWLTQVPTFIYRNYNIIQDGRKNITKIPVEILKCEYNRNSSFLDNVNYSDCTKLWDNDKIIASIDIKDLPVINRWMVKNINWDRFLELTCAYELQKAKLKVAKYIKDERWIENDSIYKDMYSPEVTLWLESIGIGNNWFAPKMVWEESTDSYVAQELKVSVKGMSSLPKVTDAVENPSTLSKKIVANYYNELSKDNNIESTIDIQTKDKYQMESEISQYVFWLVLSQKWFDWMEEWTTVKKEYMWYEFDVTIEMNEKSINI